MCNKSFFLYGWLARSAVEGCLYEGHAVATTTVEAAVAITVT